jgi:hypothetical protein
MIQHDFNPIRGTKPRVGSGCVRGIVFCLAVQAAFGIAVLIIYAVSKGFSK